jgi:hypothetical protein
MDERTGRVSDLLHEAGEVHHVVYRITNGADDTGPRCMQTGYRITPNFPTRSAAHRYGAASSTNSLRARLCGSGPSARWQDFYADRIVDRFG